MALTGYTGTVSALAGEAIDLFLSTDGPPGSYSIEIRRVGGSEFATVPERLLRGPRPVRRAGWRFRCSSFERWVGFDDAAVS
jgi:hypothetical protein